MAATMSIQTCLISLGIVVMQTASGSQTARPEATSLMGKPLYPAPIAAEARKTLEENLKNAS